MPFQGKAKDVEELLANKPELYPRPKPGEKKGGVKTLPLSTLKGYNPYTKIRGYAYDMSTYFQKNVERYRKET